MGPEDEEMTDFMTAPVLVSMVLGGILLLLLVFCRLYMLLRKRKNRANNPQGANGNGTQNQRTNRNQTTRYSDFPPSYENVTANIYTIDVGSNGDLGVPGVYLNGSIAEDETPPPKYDEVTMENGGSTSQPLKDYCDEKSDDTKV